MVLVNNKKADCNREKLKEILSAFKKEKLSDFSKTLWMLAVELQDNHILIIWNNPKAE
ncbi:hypothetical protein D3C87_326800 [compost metagenome]